MAGGQHQVRVSRGAADDRQVVPGHRAPSVPFLQPAWADRLVQVLARAALQRIQARAVEAGVETRDLIPVLQPMVSADGLVSGYAQTNALILVDSSANVERLARLVAELDVASSRRQTAMVSLRHAAAGELADTIQLALEERGVPGAAPAAGKPAPAAALKAFKITPDERTNMLIVSARPSRCSRSRRWSRSWTCRSHPAAGKCTCTI